MKKLFFLLVGVAISAAAMSQTPQTEKKEDMKNLRGDVRDHKVATHKVNKDLTHARVGKAVHDHKAVHQINKDENANARSLKEQGVSHPVVKAKRQVKVQDDNRKDHTNE
jgi:hypothetical protein